MASLKRCYNIADLRLRAKSFLPKGVFEYVDRGAEDEVAVVENLEAFKRIKLRTHFMVDLRKMDLGTTIFGKRWSIPYAVSPTGTTGLLWYQGEIVLAKACGAKGIPFTLGTNSITAIETVMRACPETNIWFQLYMWSEEEDSYTLVRRARDAGCQTLIVTIDGALGNNREYNKRNGFSVPFTLSPRSAYDMLTHPRWLAGVLGPLRAQQRHADARELPGPLPPPHHDQDERQPDAPPVDDLGRHQQAARTVERAAGGERHPAPRRRRSRHRGRRRRHRRLQPRRPRARFGRRRPSTCCRRSPPS